MMSRLILAIAGLALAGAGIAQERPKLTAHERSQGWRLLFDGRDVSDWRGLGLNKLPPNWRVSDGSLAGAAGPALVSNESYADFELQLDWRVAEGGQGTVYFRVDEDAGAPELTGPAVLLAGHGDTLAGSGLMPPERAVVPQFGVWYRLRIVVYGNLVEHHLNGDRVLSYVLGSPDWRRALAAGTPPHRDFGRLLSGRIALVGDGVEFRNIKVRAL